MPLVAQYAGLRCNCAEGSFHVLHDDGGASGVTTVTGVRSTGFTAAAALARYIVRGMVEHHHRHHNPFHGQVRVWYSMVRPPPPQPLPLPPRQLVLRKDEAL